MTFARAFVGHVMVYVGGPKRPSQGEWEEHIAALRAHAAAYPNMCSIIWPGAAGLTPRERGQVARTLPKGARTAVMTASALSRGVVTALSWFGLGIRAFALNQESEAVAHLGLSTDAAKRVLAAAKRLRAEMEAQPVRAG